MRYGAPYKGSKNKVAEWVVSNLPAADVLVDVFAGGGAISHCALLSGKWGRVVSNDIGSRAFERAVRGDLPDPFPVPTRDEFAECGDEAVRLLYSFGNDRRTYLWGRDIEPVKVEASRMLSAPTLHDRRMHYKRFVRALRAYLCDGNGMSVSHKLVGSDGNHGLQGLQGLEGLERLEGLQGLEGLELAFSHADYRDLDVPEGATVYADPPYRGTRTNQYAAAGDFDFAAFDAWLAYVPFLVVVSEYTCPDGCVEVARKERRSMCEANSNSAVKAERLFVQERFLPEYRRRMAA